MVNILITNYHNVGLIKIPYEAFWGIANLSFCCLVSLYYIFG